MIAKIYKLFTTYSFLMLSLSINIVMTNTAQAEEFFTIKNGELQRPSGYREWIYVGTPTYAK